MPVVPIANIQALVNLQQWGALGASWRSVMDEQYASMAWLRDWLRVDLQDCDAIARIEGQTPILRPVVLDEEPQILSSQGCFTFEELRDADGLPTLLDIEQGRLELRLARRLNGLLGLEDCGDDEGSMD